MAIDRERLVGTFSKLVSIDSPSFGERRMGDYLKEQLAGLGLGPREDDAGAAMGGACGNLYGYLEGDPAMPPVLFCGHMDTVEPSAGKQAVIGEDGVIRSGGDTVLGADDCAGIAAILEALQVIRENRLPHRPVEVLFSVAEEKYCKGIARFDFSKLKSREAYVPDLAGPVGTAALAAPSILSFTVQVHGRSAHAGFAPQEGIHAVQAAAAAVASLTLGKLDEDTTLNIGAMEGGQATNVVPDLCTVTGEIRSFSHKKALSLAEAVRIQFETFAAAVGASVTFSLQTDSEAFETPENHPVVRRFRAACALLGLPVSLIRTFGGSDNNVLAGKGIAGIVLASTMYECHSCAEYTTVDELARLAELILTLMTNDSSMGELT